MRIPGSEGTKINGARVKETGTYGSLTLGCVFKSRKTIFFFFFFFFYFFLLSLMGANSLLNALWFTEEFLGLYSWEI